MVWQTPVLSKNAMHLLCFAGMSREWCGLGYPTLILCSWVSMRQPCTGCHLLCAAVGSQRCTVIPAIAAGSSSALHVAGARSCCAALARE